MSQCGNYEKNTYSDLWHLPCDPDALRECFSDPVEESRVFMALYTDIYRA